MKETTRKKAPQPKITLLEFTQRLERARSGTNLPPSLPSQLSDALMRVSSGHWSTYAGQRAAALLLDDVGVSRREIGRLICVDRKDIGPRKRRVMKWGVEGLEHARGAQREGGVLVSPIICPREVGEERLDGGGGKDFGGAKNHKALWRLFERHSSLHAARQVFPPPKVDSFGGLEIPVAPYPRRRAIHGLYFLYAGVDSVIWQMRMRRNYIRGLGNPSDGWVRCGSGVFLKTLWTYPNTLGSGVSEPAVVLRVTSSSKGCNVELIVYSVGRWVHGGAYPHPPVTKDDLKRLQMDLSRRLKSRDDRCFLPLYEGPSPKDAPFRVDVFLDVPYTPLHLIEVLEYSLGGKSLKPDSPYNEGQSDCGRRCVGFHASGGKNRAYEVKMYAKGSQMADTGMGQSMYHEQYGLSDMITKRRGSDCDAVNWDSVMRVEVSLYPRRQRCRAWLERIGFSWSGEAPTLLDFDSPSGNALVIEGVLNEFSPHEYDPEDPQPPPPALGLLRAARERAAKARKAHLFAG